MPSLFRRNPSHPAPAPAPGDDLFDEAFQQRLEYLALVSRRVFTGRQRADRRSRRIGSGIEFADYRQYAPGDDIRQLDWNVYGRLGRLLLRLYEEEEDLSVYLLIDCSASMAFGQPSRLDYAKKLAAALAYVGLSRLDRVSIHAFAEGAAQRLAPARGRHRIFKVFAFLRGLQPSGGTHLAEGLRNFAARTRRRGVAILISDLYDSHGFEDGINQLRFARFETYVLQLTADDELALRLNGEVELQDSESGELVHVTVTPAVLERYARQLAEHRAHVERFCKGKQVPLFTLEVGTPPETAVLHMLRRGGMVG
jgi:uncharacterized protein (DUF58 family)